MGITVDRPIEPTSIELSTDEAVIRDPHSYAVKVNWVFDIIVLIFFYARICRLHSNILMYKTAR